VPPAAQTAVVAVTGTVVVVKGVGKVVVMAVMPQQEQALLYLAAPSQALAYVGTLPGVTVTCLCSKIAGWRFLILTRVVVATVVDAVIVEVAGVTLISMKLEQSCIREATSGIFPLRVPVTALAQLLSLHPAERAPWASAKDKINDKSFIAKPVKVDIYK